MRRLPTQAKEKVSGSPRVAQRLHQLKDRKEKSKGQDSNYDNGADVGIKEETGVMEAEEEGKDAEEPETAAGDKVQTQSQSLSSDQQQKRPGSATSTNTSGTGEPVKQPQQLSSTKRSSGDTQEGDDSESRRKRRKDNPDPSDAATSVESPGPKVPPLKIVLGGSSGGGGGSGGEEQTKKSGGSRLPYVVHSFPFRSTDDISSPEPWREETPPPVETPALPVVGNQQPAVEPPPTVPSQEQMAQQQLNPPQNGQDDAKDSHKRVLRSHRSGNGSSGQNSPAGMDVSSPRSQVSPTPPEGGLQPASPAVKEEETVQPKEETTAVSAPVELHPRKRKLKQPRETETSTGHQSAESAGSPSSTAGTNAPQAVVSEPPPPANCYQLFLNIRKQIDRRRKGLFPVQPKPPQGFKDYLMNRCTYVLAGNANNRIPPPNQTPPTSVSSEMKDMFLQQEKERYRLRTQHVIEKEKLVLSVEQEILRVHGRAARALANQALPFSACTILRDEEVYSPFSAEQEEKERNARSRYNGRLFLSWLQDVDDKWEKIKEAMLLRHHNEAESLHAVQKMDWTWKLKELQPSSGTIQEQPPIEECHVPMVHVSDDFDLLPT